MTPEVVTEQPYSVWPVATTDSPGTVRLNLLRKEAQIEEALDPWEEASWNRHRRNQQKLRRQHLLSSRPIVPNTSVAEITWCAVRVVAREVFFTLGELKYLRATRQNYRLSLNAAIFNLRNRADLFDRVVAHRDQLFEEYKIAVAKAQALETELMTYGVWVRRRLL